MLRGQCKGQRLAHSFPFSDVTDGLIHGAETAARRLTEPVIRLGVTGVSRAGKTVFITGLVANLLDRGRMAQLRAESAGQIMAVHLQPQPDLTLPRFDFETHLAALTADVPEWPQSTRQVSELRLSFLLRPRGLLGAMTGPRRLHLDIVDYPGEWLLDVGLLPKSYAEWSEGVLDRLATRPEARAYLALARAEDGAQPFAEGAAQALAATFADYLQAARAAGYGDCTPGRFLLPGDLAGSPVLTFAPLPQPGNAPRGSLWREMARRYDGYKDRVVRPFFRDHFARIDRQVVLVDVLGAVHAGPAAVEDLRRSMADVLAAFRPGANSWLAQLLGARRAERILFAATKADHLHHSQHAALTALTDALLRQARDRADFAGARTEAMSLAAFRATTEDRLTRDGVAVDCVRGRLADGRSVALWPGLLPDDPGRILGPARRGDPAWLGAEFALMAFAPAPYAHRAGDGPPHIRLDRAAEFLIGDRL